MIDQIVSLDLQILHALIAARTENSLLFFKFVTALASPVAVILGMGAASCLLAMRKRARLAAILCSGLIGTEVVMYALKHLVRRERPDIALRAVVEDGFSMPSGHATSAAFFFGVIAYLLIRSTNLRKWQKAIVVLVAAVAIVAVDNSRMYLGVHYFSDVIAGNVLGFLGLFATVAIVERVRNKKT